MAQTREQQKEWYRMRSSDPEYRAKRNEYARQYYRRRKNADPEYNEANRIRNKLRDAYGLTPGQYDAMVVACKGVCEMCGKPERQAKRLAVDHNHKTGVVRGLLCHHCNCGLGHFNDSIEDLEKAIAYLKKF